MQQQQQQQQQRQQQQEDGDGSAGMHDETGRYVQNLTGLVGITFAVDVIARRFAESLGTGAGAGGGGGGFGAGAQRYGKRPTFDADKLVLPTSTVVVAKPCSSTLLAEKLAVAAVLWEAGIPTEVLWEPHTSRGLRAVAGYCDERRFRWVVTVRPREDGRAARVRLRCVETQGEADVAVDALADVIEYCSGVPGAAGAPRDADLELVAAELLGAASTPLRDSSDSLRGSSDSLGDGSGGSSGSGSNSSSGLAGAESAEEFAALMRRMQGRTQFSIPVVVGGSGGSGSDGSSNGSGCGGGGDGGDADEPATMFDVKVLRRMRFETDRAVAEKAAACARGVLGGILQGGARVRVLAVDLPHAYLHDIASDPLHCARGWDALVTRHMDETSRRRILAAVERARDLVALLRTPEYTRRPLVVLYSALDDRCELLTHTAFGPAPEPARTHARARSRTLAPHGAVPAPAHHPSRRGTRTDRL